MVGTVGELLGALRAYDATMERVRRIGAKVTSAPVKGSPSAYYAIQADSTQRDAERIHQGIVESPGYSDIKTITEAEYGHLKVEPLQQMRGRLAVAIRRTPEEINEFGLREFADLYITHAASPDLARIAKSKESQPLLSVSCWSELAIGLDGRSRIWARKPVPDIGDRFEISTATRIHLRGKQWPALLRLLADSNDGMSVPRYVAIQALGFYSPTSGVVSDKRSRPGAIESDLVNSELLSHTNAPRKQLNDALKSLASKLRKQVGGPTRTQGKALFVEEDYVRSGFVVRYLIPDGAGHHSFGRSSSEAGG